MGPSFKHIRTISIEQITGGGWLVTWCFKEEFTDKKSFFDNYTEASNFVTHELLRAPHEFYLAKVKEETDVDMADKPVEASANSLPF